MHRTLSRIARRHARWRAVPAAAGGIPAARGRRTMSRRVTVTDLDGRSVQPLARLDGAARGAVFVFTRSDCPIANRYAPDLERLQQAGRGGIGRVLARLRRPRRERRGVSVSTCGVRLHRPRAARPPARSGARRRRDDRTGSGGVRTRARGAAARVPRTDRRPLSGSRPHATRRDHARSGGRDRRAARGASSCTARDAGGGMRHRRSALIRGPLLIAIAVGVAACAVPACTRTPVGGTRRRSRPSRATSRRSCSATALPAITPAVPGRSRCSTFDDARRRARQIVKVTSSRYMPPWPPEPGHGRFVGERRLSDAEIATLAAWQRAGSPEGDPSALPPAPTLYHRDGSWARQTSC